MAPHQVGLNMKVRPSWRGELSQAAVMSLFEYTLFSLTSLFVIVDPIAVIPAFLAMTPTDSPEMRLHMAKIACLVAAGVLLGFTLTGDWIFKLLGLTLPAFQIAGSAILMMIALDMLKAERSKVRLTHEEREAGTEKEDIAITPLAVPLLTGPGALSTCLILLNHANGFSQRIALMLDIIVVFAVSYLILRLAVHGARWISPIVIRVVSRLMGLLLAAVAVQFFLNALTTLKVITAR